MSHPLDDGLCAACRAEQARAMAADEFWAVCDECTSRMNWSNLRPLGSIGRNGKPVIDVSVNGEVRLVSPRERFVAEAASAWADGVIARRRL